MKNRLSDIRRKNNLTQDELAGILEVSRQTISSIENGKYNPSTLLAFRIARYFDLTVEQIFIYEEDENEI